MYVPMCNVYICNGLATYVRICTVVCKTKISCQTRFENEKI